MGRPRRSEAEAAGYNLQVRLTTVELAALDGLRKPGESRAGAVRRLLDRVAYAAQVARAAVDEADMPTPDDPRRLAATGSTGIYIPLGVAVVDAETSVVLHEDPPTKPLRPREPAPLAEEPWPGDVRDE